MNPTSNRPLPTLLLNRLHASPLRLILGLAWLALAFGAAARPQPAPQPAADEPQVGFIRIIHAVAAGNGKAAFLLDGTDLFPKGYELGQATGGIGIAAGTHKVEITRNGTERGNTEVMVKPGETTTLIGFSEPIPQIDPNAPPAWKIRILRLRQSSPQSGYQLSLVSVCPEPETVVQSSIADRPGATTARVERFRISTVPLGRTRSEVFVRSGPDLLTTVSPDSPGNYVVVLYRDPTHTLRALSFYDPKFVIAG